jgi:uncharacterized membrane protein YccC
MMPHLEHLSPTNPKSQPRMQAHRPSRSQQRLLAENTDMAERLRRLAPALAGLARELAQTRRACAALERENAQLKAQTPTQHLDPLRR